MRRLNQICAQLPITSRETYEKYAFGEYSDIATINLLASITKGFELLKELFSDYKLTFGYGKDIGDDYDTFSMRDDDYMFSGIMDKKFKK